MRFGVGQDEWDSLSRFDIEIGHRGEILATQWYRGAQPGRVGAGDRDQIVVVPAHPRHDMAVVEAQSQVHVHRHRPGDTFDDAHDVGLGASGWHEVDEAHRAFIGVPLGFEDQRVAPVAAARRAPTLGGRDLPASCFAVPEQRGETGRGVEPRQ